MPRRSSTASPRCCSPTRRPMQHALAEPLAALIVSLAPKYDALRRARDHQRQERHAARRRAARRHAGVRCQQDAVGPDTFERPIYAGNAIQTVKSKDAKKVITVRTSTFQAAGEGGSAADRSGDRGGRSGDLVVRRRGIVEVGAARADLGQDHHLRRPRDAEPRQLRQIHRAGGRQARRRGRRLARRGRRRLCAERLAGRPDRQGGRAGALHRGRHFRRDPAPRRA